MNKRKTGEMACLLCCVLLAGCAAAGNGEIFSDVFPYFTAGVTAPLAPTETASAAPVASPSAIPTAAVTPTATVPSPAAATPAPQTSSPDVLFSALPVSSPSAQAGVNIRHEGFGENTACVIVLDPGHQRTGMSEKEPNSPATDVMKAKVTYGAQGVATNIPEYELNLAVALYARDALLAKGYTVIMTHETADVFISNKERAEMANDASLLLHIHANGADRQSAHGAMTICPTRENPACGDLYDESRKLADTLLNIYCEKTGILKEYVWETDTMTGINWSRVPVATLEMGYMSNPDEDRLMATDAFRRAAADAIAQAIDGFLHS